MIQCFVLTKENSFPAVYASNKSKRPCMVVKNDLGIHVFALYPVPKNMGDGAYVSDDPEPIQFERVSYDEFVITFEEFRNELYK